MASHADCIAAVLPERGREQCEVGGTAFGLELPWRE